MPYCRVTAMVEALSPMVQKASCKVEALAESFALPFPPLPLPLFWPFIPLRLFWVLYASDFALFVLAWDWDLDCDLSHCRDAPGFSQSSHSRDHSSHSFQLAFSWCCGCCLGWVLWRVPLVQCAAQSTHFIACFLLILWQFVHRQGHNSISTICLEMRSKKLLSLEWWADNVCLTLFRRARFKITRPFRCKNQSRRALCLCRRLRLLCVPVCVGILNKVRSNKKQKK